MAERDPEELADRLEREAGDMERRSRDLEGRTEDVAQEWQRKRADESIPGAPPPPPTEEDKDEESAPTGSPTGKGEGDSGDEG